MRLDRFGSDALMEALQSNPYSFLPDLVRAQPTPPGWLDLRFRCNSKTGWSEAVLYAGERAAVHLVSNGKAEPRLDGPDKPLTPSAPEGRVHAAFCSRFENAVLDRESAFRFGDDPGDGEAEKRSILESVREPLQAAVDAYVPSDGKALPPPPSLGQEIDAIAVEPDGALAIIEVKPGAETGAIGWTPAQVTFYAHVFQYWIDLDPITAGEILRKMLSQRIELRLIQPVELREPILVRPVIALESELRSSAVAQHRAEDLQRHLLRSGVGCENLEARAIEPDGSTRELHWFGR